MTTSTPNDHSTDQPATQPEQPTTGVYEPYQWESASQPAASSSSDSPTTSATPADGVSYMWSAPSRVIGGAEPDEQPGAPTTGRDPRETPSSIPQSGPAPWIAQSGRVGGSERRRPGGCALAVGGCLVVVAALIALCALSLGVITALAATSRPATTSATRTFHVSGAPTLALNISAAAVRVTGDPTDSGAVTMTMTASAKTTSYDSSRSVIQAIKFTTTQTGNIITIGLTDDYNSQLSLFLSRNVILDITTPAHTSVRGELQAGVLTTDDLTGALNVTTDAGAVTLHQMTFTGSSVLQLSAGSLTADGSLAQGATVGVTVDAGSAAFTLPRQSGAHLVANASSGSVNVIGWNATVTRDAADASTSGDVGAHPTGSLAIHVNAGSVVVTLV